MRPSNPQKKARHNVKITFTGSLQDTAPTYEENKMPESTPSNSKNKRKTQLNTTLTEELHNRVPILWSPCVCHWYPASHRCHCV